MKHLLMTLAILASVSSLAVAGLPAAPLTITAAPDGAVPVDLAVVLSEVDDEERSWFGVVRAPDGRALLQVHVDSHGGRGDPWHEVLLSNGSIETGAGFWRGEYSVELAGERVERRGALFYDGTGYLELFGEPVLELTPPVQGGGYLSPLWDLLADHEKRAAYLGAIRSGSVAPGLEAFPHGETWDPGDWHTEQFDPAYNTHQTGSPSNAGVVGPLAARAAALSVHGGPADDHLAIGWRRAVWGKLGQQSRRPIHFYHDDTGEVWRAVEWPDLVMGEYGPTKLWGARELWGRGEWTSAARARGAWNGWDLEHLEVHTQAAGWVLFRSRFALRELRHKVEASLTYPHLKESKETSPRVYGWGLQALALAAELDPDLARARTYRDGADFVISYFLDHVQRKPRWSIQSRLSAADGRHLMPSPEELAAYFDWAGWSWPMDDEEVVLAEAQAVEKQAILDRLREEGASADDVKRAAYVAGEARKAVVWTASAWVGRTYGSKAQWAMLRVWGFVPCFQVGTIAAGLLAYARLPDVDPNRVRAVANELIAYLVLEARVLPDEVPAGAVPTFWYDTAVWIPGRNVGAGVETTGVVHWVAGGLGCLGEWIPLPWRAEWRAAVDSVYRRTKYAKPGVYGSSFESWFLAYAAAADVPLLE